MLHVLRAVKDGCAGLTVRVVRRKVLYLTAAARARHSRGFIYNLVTSDADGVQLMCNQARPGPPRPPHAMASCAARRAPSRRSGKRLEGEDEPEPPHSTMPSPTYEEHAPERVSTAAAPRASTAHAHHRPTSRHTLCRDAAVGRRAQVFTLVSSPIRICVAMVLLYAQLGAASFAALMLLICLLPAQVRAMIASAPRLRQATPARSLAAGQALPGQAPSRACPSWCTV